MRLDEPKTDKTKELRESAFAKLREAEAAMYKYFCACDLGPEREKANQIYENVRCAARVF